MTAKEKPRIPLPKDWTGNVRSAVLHVISLAQYTTAYTRSWASNSPNERMRLKTENGRLEAEVALLTEEIRIKDARLLSLDSCKRPQYPLTERMAILELRAARRWVKAGKRPTPSISHRPRSPRGCVVWMSPVPMRSSNFRNPSTSFSDFVRYSVQQLKSLCPSMGKVKLAGVLARAGLHLGSTNRRTDRQGATRSSAGE